MDCQDFIMFCLFLTSPLEGEMISLCDSILYMVDFTFKVRLYLLILVYLFSNQLALAAESSQAIHSVRKGLCGLWSSAFICSHWLCNATSEYF